MLSFIFSGPSQTHECVRHGRTRTRSGGVAVREATPLACQPGTLTDPFRQAAILPPPHASRLIDDGSTGPVAVRRCLPRAPEAVAYLLPGAVHHSPQYRS